MFREDCWFIHGFNFGKYYVGILRYHSSGEIATVDFDWKKVFNSKTFLGWYHSHPGEKNLIPSSTDNKTLRSWIKASSRTFLCGIKCCGEHRCYCYYGRWLEVKRETSVFYKAIGAKLWGSFFIGKDNRATPFSASWKYGDEE